MIRNLTRFYKKHAKPYLYAGRMIPSPEPVCETITFNRRDSTRTVTLPAILCSAWEAENRSRVMILVNPNDTEAHCRVEKRDITVPALNAIMLPL